MHSGAEEISTIEKMLQDQEFCQFLDYLGDFDYSDEVGIEKSVVAGTTNIEPLSPPIPQGDGIKKPTKKRSIFSAEQKSEGPSLTIITPTTAAPSGFFSAQTGATDKKRQRMQSNRVSAKQSREKRADKLQESQQRILLLEQQIIMLESENSGLTHENSLLKQQNIRLLEKINVIKTLESGGEQGQVDAYSTEVNCLSADPDQTFAYKI